MFYKVCKFDEISEIEMSKVLILLSNEQREYIINKPSAKRRQSLAARVLLYKLLNKHHPDVNLCNLRFNENGKPYITDNENIYISITHSHDMVGCAVSEKPIGIDVEKKRDVAVKTINRVCTVCEQKYLEKQPMDFFKFWTAKEALYKAVNDSFSNVIKHSFSDGENFIYDKSYINLYSDENSEYFWTVIELSK